MLRATDGGFLLGSLPTDRPSVEVIVLAMPTVRCVDRVPSFLIESWSWLVCPRRVGLRLHGWRSRVDALRLEGRGLGGVFQALMTDEGYPREVPKEWEEGEGERDEEA